MRIFKHLSKSSGERVFFYGIVFLFAVSIIMDGIVNIIKVICG